MFESERAVLVSDSSVVVSPGESELKHEQSHKEKEKRMDKVKIGTENMSDIAAKTQTLIQASMKLGEAMYASGAASSGDDTDGDSKDDGVVDAEFEEVDGKKSA